MSRLADLIAELCPDGVEFERLGGLVRIRNGKDYKALGSGEIPVYGTGGVMLHVDTAAHPGPSVLIPRKGSLDKLYYVDKPFWTVDTIFYTEIGDRLVPKFLYYHLSTQHLEELNQAAGIPSLTQSVLNFLLVPVPPLDVQREIVRILDQFTQLEAELEAELEARRRQYEHVRDQLLSTVAEDNDWRRLDEVASVRVGQAPSNGVPAATGPYAYINAGTTQSGRASTSNTLGDAVTIPSRGQGGVGVVGYQAEDFWCGPLCYRVISSTVSMKTRFLYYYLKSIQPSIRGLQQTGGTPALNRKELVLVQVPVPPIQVQERVISMLDKFDALVNDLSVGLPAELAARRKQYEYYRDRLLTFEEAIA